MVFKELPVPYFSITLALGPEEELKASFPKDQLAFCLFLQMHLLFTFLACVLLQ
jgi:hypothetical protein